MLNTDKVAIKENIDVLFIYTNINGFHSDTYNFGIGYLSSVLKENGFDTELAVVKTRRDYRGLLRAVKEYRPKVVGFSTVSSQFIFVSELAEMVKKAHDCVAVAGGVHPTIFPDCIFSAPHLDGIFVGESEYSFLDFVSKVTKRLDYKGVDNFYYVSDGRLVKNRLKPRVKDLQELPFPDRYIYDYQSVINENGGMTTILTSRGCPFHCTYCSNIAIGQVYKEDKNYIRYNSVDKTLEEIDILRSKYKFESLWFISDLFILNRNWLSEFLDKYKKTFDIPFMCQIRPNICTRDILFDLRDAGCYKIFIGVESANDHIRNGVMKRGITRMQLENTFNWAKEAGLETLSANIIGVPDETEESVMETIEFNKKVCPTVVGVNMFSPYEGTQLGEYCTAKGLLKKTNLRVFFDRQQSRLAIPTISDRKLMHLYDEFQYLVYKDAYPEKARQLLWRRRYERLESDFLFGFFFKKFRPFLRGLARLLFQKAAGQRVKSI